MKIEFCTTVMEFFLNIIVYTLPELDWQKYSQLKAYLYQRHQSKEIFLNNIYLVSRSRMSSYLWAVLCSR